ncbi:MAG TPA: 3-phosphoshikimate 1-carboxyvinyltransferase [Bryobacteraceae bacterium]|nr:3-phosphoshikimate 1-carboxyvinyltransferase [Bryobacteraceae bacterium]
MAERVSPATRLAGSVRLPGDKSISHRYAMLGAVATGSTRIHNYSTGADCASTLACIGELGARVERSGSVVTIGGAGLQGLRQPAGTLDAGNSGSTIRMMSGILAAQSFPSRITGDASLRRRPMDRILRPLEAMGASISASDGHFPPLDIQPARLRAIDYELPVASAQVKTCILLAGLYADGVTAVIEKIRTRDHTELALKGFGAEIDVEGRTVLVRGPAKLRGREVSVPGDLSSAAFFLVAALLVPGSVIEIEGVGMNPTRSALLDFLAGMGAAIKVRSLAFQTGEAVGNLEIRHGRLTGGVIEKALTAALIDEIPVLAVLGAITDNGLTVRDAAELRVKETDRIATVADNLQRMGIRVELTADGFHVPGCQRFRAATLDSFGDHRIAMAFSVAALAADGECTIDGSEAAGVSFPEFYTLLNGLRA